MMRISTIVLALILATSAAFAGPPVKDGKSSAGPVLTDVNGMTLYNFDKDAKGVSNCDGPCSGIWPPLAATANDKAEGDYDVITRKDGSRQWTYDGLPLYTFASDKAAGDVTGDGVKGVWHLVRP